MSIVFALVSAFSYGVSDFLGGLFSKKSSPWQIAVVGQASSAVSAFVLGLIITGTVTQADWLWAAGGGIGAGIGAAFLYRGLSSGRMAVVAPISAIGSALLPVAVGVALGDRPNTLAIVGIVLALPAIYLISKVTEQSARTSSTQDGNAPSGGVLDGVLAGLGFGSLFVLIGQVDSDAGLMPIAAMQVTAVLGVIVVAAALRQPWVPRDRSSLPALMMGPLGALATGSFLLATHEGLLSIVSVIASLYPATTVVLAAVILRERIHRMQGVGLGLAAIAVTLVAIG